MQRGAALLYRSLRPRVFFRVNSQLATCKNYEFVALFVSFVPRQKFNQSLVCANRLFLFGNDANVSSYQFYRGYATLRGTRKRFQLAFTQTHKTIQIGINKRDSTCDTYFFEKFDLEYQANIQTNVNTRMAHIFYGMVIGMPMNARKVNRRPNLSRTTKS